MLPDGLDLRFDSEHVDIMGSSTTAKYVVEGLQHNGRFFFDFELRERFDDGMSTDVDVLGCRYDNAVTAGNAQQKIIVDGDDLFVDLVSKPVFLFNSMIMIRVRGEGMRSWDFTAGVSNTDQDMSTRWDEVKEKMSELAESIQLIGAGKKKAKKKKVDKSSDTDFIISNGVLRKYTGKKTDIVIPDGVKEIADSTFSGFSNLRSVVVPEGVKRIGRRCFENCTNLERCDLPDSLEELGGYAFVDCHNLKEIHLSEKLKAIGDSAFSECFVLKDVVIPKKIKEIDAFTFKNCDAFKRITIPEGVKSIGFSAFAACDELEYLYIPASVTEFADSSFNSHPFDGSRKLTIYTPAGSPAQKFAEKKGIPFKNENSSSITSAKLTSSKSAPKKSASKAKKKASTSAASGKTVTVDNTWVVTVPDGFKYSTDKKIIGDHRNIIILEDKPENDFEWPFQATISFTSMFNESQGLPAVSFAKTMAGFIGGNDEIIRDEDDIYVAYGHQPNRSYKEDGESLDVFQMFVGCGNGASSIQVFFSNSKLSHREQTKLVEKVAKSVKLVGEAGTQNYTAEEKGTLEDAQNVLEDIGKALDDIRDYLDATEDMRLGLMEYFDKMEEREKKEKAQRKENKKKAAAAGKSDDDIVNLYVVLCNEEKAKTKGVTASKFYKLYEDFFPAFTKDELWDARKDMLAKMQDKALCNEYSDLFKGRNIRDRFNVATKSYFKMALNIFHDSTLCAEDAVENTADWFIPDEMSAVKQLMNDELVKQNNRITEQFSWAEPDWIKYSKAKDYLEIQINDYKERKELVSDECRMFQVKLDAPGGPFLVAPVLRQKTFMPLAVNVMDACTHYWGVSQSEIWEVAFRNNVRNSTDVSLNEKQYAKKAMKIAKDNYPDIKEIKRIRKEESEKKVGIFIKDIKRLCQSNVYVKVADSKKVLINAFPSASELAEHKEKLAEEAANENLEFLTEILTDKDDIQELHRSLAESLTDKINIIIHEKIAAANEAEYKKATSLFESDDIKDVNEAESIFATLGQYKDAIVLEKQCAEKAENIKSARYDEARSLFAEGTESSMEKAIGLLGDLGKYRDAQDLAAEYKETIKKEKAYQEVLKGVESDSLYELRNIKEKLEGLTGYKNADELLNACDDKMESLMSEMYDKAVFLAAESTVAALTDARATMSVLKPFRDSAEKVEEYGILLRCEKAYKAALDLMGRDDLNSLEEAKSKFDEMHSYKDSAEKSSECEAKISDLKKVIYGRAREAEKTLTVVSQQTAFDLYKKLGGINDSKERLEQCKKNISALNEIKALENKIDKNKDIIEELKKHFFKKGEIKACEAEIKEANRTIDELRKNLTITEASDQSIREINSRGDSKKKKPKLILVGVILIIVFGLIIVLLSKHPAILNGITSGGTGTSQETTIDNETSNGDGSSLGNVNNDIITIIENGSYAVTCGELKDVLLSRMRNVNPSFRDLTTEFESAGYYAMGSNTNREGDSVTESFMIKVLPGGRTNHSSDTIQCFSFIASDDTDYSEYFAEGILAADPSLDKEYVEKVLSRNYEEGKEAQLSQEMGNMTFYDLTFNDLKVYYTVHNNTQWCAITDPSMDFSTQFNSCINVW